VLVWKNVALVATLGTALSTLLLQTGKTPKIVVHTMAGSVVRGNAQNSQHFKTWSLLAMWYKQVTARCAMIGGSLLSEKVLYVAIRLGIKDFRACNGWIMFSNSGTLLCTKPYCGCAALWAFHHWRYAEVNS
jgi:hypothetical protein